MRLLIVDDEPSILELLGVALKALGTYKVKTATSAKQALQMIEGKPREFDAFLLDIQMPEMTGIDLCAEIRRNELYKNAPILMLTAMSQMSYVEKAFEAGATDYVTKPFNFEDLKQRLNTARKLKYSKASVGEAEDNPSMMRSVLYHESQDYASELDFSKVERFIGKAEFENYVRQMSLSKASQTCAFALRVGNGAEINVQTSSMDFFKTMMKVAQELVYGTQSAGSLLTYVGSGVFVCAEHGNRLTDTEKLERAIATALSPATFTGPCPEIAIGEHAEMETFDPGSGPKLIEDAIERAMQRDVFTVGPSTQSNVTHISSAPVARPQSGYVQRPQRPAQSSQSSGSSPSKARPDRQAYEKMLLDSLRNG